MAQRRWFRLLDEHGHDADGNHEPIREVGFTVLLPERIVDGKTVGAEIGRVVLHPSRLDPRVISTDQQVVADAILYSGQYVEIDRPTSDNPDTPPQPDGRADTSHEQDAKAVAVAGADLTKKDAGAQPAAKDAASPGADTTTKAKG